MTDQTLSSSVSENSTGQESVVLENSAPEVQQPQIAEKMIPQSQVGKIAGASRKEGHDAGFSKGYQEALASLQNKQASNTDVAFAPTAPSVNSPNAQASQSKNEADIKTIIAQQVAESLKQERDNYIRNLEEKRQAEESNQLVAQLKPKLEESIAQHEDFMTAVGALQLDKAPFGDQVLKWVNSVPNAGEVLYDLAKNPAKFGSLLSLQYNPALAIQQIHAISQSLQNNQTAQEKRLPKEPLSVVQPSNVGKTVGELSGQALTDESRKKYRF